MDSRLWQRASKSECLVVPPLFRADSERNLIKQGENVKDRPRGSEPQLAECSHGKREALGSSPGRATMFSSPVTDTHTHTHTQEKNTLYFKTQDGHCKKGRAGKRTTLPLQAL